MKNALVTLNENDIAPRFDLAQEVLIAFRGRDRKTWSTKRIVLARPSAEALCRLVSSEDVQTVICGGIEEEYLEYLVWKKINVIHSVIGTLDSVLRRFYAGSLRSGDILFKKQQKA